MPLEPVPLELAPLPAAPPPLAPVPPLADPVAPPTTPLEVPVVAARVPLVLATEPETGPVVAPLLGVPLPPPPVSPLPPPPLAPEAATVPLLAPPLDAELPLFWPTTLVGEFPLHAAATRRAAHGAAWSPSVRFILHRLAAQPRHREDKVDERPLY